MREKRLHLFKLVPHGLGRIQGVGARGLPDGQCRGGYIVEFDLRIIGFGAEFGPSDVPDPHDRAVLIGAEWYRREFFRRFKKVLNDNRRIQPLAGHRGRAAELSGRDFDIVSPQRGNHILYCHVRNW